LRHGQLTRLNEAIRRAEVAIADWRLVIERLTAERVSPNMLERA
jgi:hypothetical protein